jgi:hypothetical protein
VVTGERRDWLDPAVRSAADSVQCAATTAADWLLANRTDGEVWVDLLLGPLPVGGGHDVPDPVQKRLEVIFADPGAWAQIVVEWLPGGHDRRIVLAGGADRQANWLVADSQVWIGKPFAPEVLWRGYASPDASGVPFELPSAWFRALTVWGAEDQRQRDEAMASLVDVVDDPENTLSALLHVDWLRERGTTLELDGVGCLIRDAVAGGVVKVVTIAPSGGAVVETELLLTGERPGRRLAVLRSGSESVVQLVPVAADDIVAMLQVLASPTDG